MTKKQYQKVNITCPCCKQEHKLRLYKFDDIFECPPTHELFKIDSNYTIKVLDSASTKREDYSPSVVIYDELLPLVEIFPAKKKKLPSEVPLPLEERKTVSIVSGDVQNSKTTVEVLEFGKYHIINKLSVGGFGIVLNAFDTFLKRYVAIKISKHILDQGEKDAFKKEAEILAKLNHPNIVHVYDFGINDQQNPFIVMEFVEGQNICEFSLKVKQERQKDFLDKICQCFFELTQALYYLHNKEVYHQDIKPQNILVSQEGNLKLIDFGLATIGNKTIQGYSGTYAYSAPERFDSGFKPTSMADIYSFGAVFFEALTGRRANTGKTWHEVLGNIYNKNICFHDNDEIDSSLKKICLKCMEGKPGDRYQNIRELHFDLASYIAIKKNMDSGYLYLSWQNSKRKIAYPFKKYPFYIGRASSNDLIIIDEKVSRLHAVIYEESSVVYIQNLSENFTVTISGTTLYTKDTKVLKWDDIIDISGYCFIYAPEKKERDRIQIEIVKKSKKFLEAEKDKPGGMEYYSFEKVLKELQMEEDEFKRLVNEGEIKAFRDEDKRKFKKSDIDGLKKTMEEPSLLLPSESSSTKNTISSRESEDTSDTLTEDLTLLDIDDLEKPTEEAIILPFGKSPNFPEDDSEVNMSNTLTEDMIPFDIDNLNDEQNNRKGDIHNAFVKAKCEDLIKILTKRFRKISKNTEIRIQEIQSVESLDILIDLAITSPSRSKFNAQMRQM